MGCVMEEYIRDIREKTSGMRWQDKCDYIITYYWYHMLITAAVLFLVITFTVHYAFGPKTPVFTCVAVNQMANDIRDDRIASEFSLWSGLPEKRVAVDSNYNFSYNKVRFEGVNESFYDKFFLKWRNKELDAVIMEESFYDYCKELGGEFKDLDEFNTGSLTLYEDGGIKTAVVIDNYNLFQTLRQESGEKLLLVFPSSGQHEETCQKFIDYFEEETGR